MSNDTTRQMRAHALQNLASDHFLQSVRSYGCEDLMTRIE